MLLYSTEVRKEKWKEKTVGKDVYLFVSCFVLFSVVFFRFVSNISSFSKRRPKTKLFYSYSRHFWLSYLVAFPKSVHFVFLRWFKLHMVCNNYLKRSSRMLGDSVVSSFFFRSQRLVWKTTPEIEFHILNTICLRFVSITAVYKEKKHWWLKESLRLTVYHTLRMKNGKFHFLIY